MAKKMKWKVLRRHEGDRMYEEGDVRIGTEPDLGHLSPKTLELIGEAGDESDAKSEHPLVNKAESALANKATVRRKAN